MNWDEAVAYALRLPGTELGTSYGKPVVKLSSNRRAFLHTGHESQTSFCVQVDRETIAELLTSDPRTYFQTQHYVGSDAVLVRYDSRDVKGVRAVIARAHAYAATKKLARKRPKKT